MQGVEEVITPYELHPWRIALHFAWHGDNLPALTLACAQYIAHAKPPRLCSLADARLNRGQLQILSKRVDKFKRDLFSQLAFRSPHSYLVALLSLP
jgi:hypothetical protein